MKHSTAIEGDLTHLIVLSLLQKNSKILTFGEEQEHSWQANRSKAFGWPLLRLWDYYSGSQPKENNHMEARAPRQRLDSFQTRKTSLTTHLNHKEWINTPFISFTRSPVALEGLANLRAEKGNRGKQFLTVIDPDSRMEDGLPVLDVLSEMHHYEIQDPYSRGSQYYCDHYVCLWEVTAKEVVGQWDWNKLATHENWYEDTIMPAYRQHRENSTLRPKDPQPNLAEIMSNLSLSSSTGIPLQTELCEASPFLAEDYYDSDLSSSSPDEEIGNEDGWDTDDEVEESNSADDLIKILEGD